MRKRTCYDVPTKGLCMLTVEASTADSTGFARYRKPAHIDCESHNNKLRLLRESTRMIVELLMSALRLDVRKDMIPLHLGTDILTHLTRSLTQILHRSGTASIERTRRHRLEVRKHQCWWRILNEVRTYGVPRIGYIVS